MKFCRNIPDGNALALVEIVDRHENQPLRATDIEDSRPDGADFLKVCVDRDHVPDELPDQRVVRPDRVRAMCAATVVARACRRTAGRNFLGGNPASHFSLPFGRNGEN